MQKLSQVRQLVDHCRTGEVAGHAFRIRDMYEDESNQVVFKQLGVSREQVDKWVKQAHLQTATAALRHCEDGLCEMHVFTLKEYLDKKWVSYNDLRLKPVKPGVSLRGNCLTPEKLTVFIHQAHVSETKRIIMTLRKIVSTKNSPKGTRQGASLSLQRLRKILATDLTVARDAGTSDSEILKFIRTFMG
ncbi:MAG: hypothetical protein V1838_04845 [Patescibacteria group bacterium]